MPDEADIGALVGRARAGEQRAVARLLSLAEGEHARSRELAAALTPFTGKARVLGLTGSPGVGKSTTTAMLVGALRDRGERVGVLAIDPSSPFSGGALLGDRIRMSAHATDPGVFIRSMAARGQLGGLASATPRAVRVLDACGFDAVLVETVGVGQSEVDIVRLADTIIVLLAPGMGDGVQAVKAGLLEIADLFVVNKADRPGADTAVQELTNLISLARKELRGARWRASIVRTVASQGVGADDLVAAIDEHAGWLVSHDQLARRRIARARSELEAIVLDRVRARLVAGGDPLNALAARVADGGLDPDGAADELMRRGDLG